MDARLKSLVTLAALGVLMVVAAVWGWASLTKPFPTNEESLCVDRTFEAGEKVMRGDVTVSVLNAGSRNGLASLTMNLFEEQGFAPGQEGNATDAKVNKVQIWTDDRRNPAVQLVKSHLGPGTPVLRKDATTAGVQVVVGDGFQDLVKGKKSVTATDAATVCGPAV